MNTQRVIVNDKTIVIPGDYSKLDPQTAAMPGTLPYLCQTENAVCLALISAEDVSQSIPHTQAALIEGIRQFLGEKQGLIQAEASDARAFSIVKTLMEPSGVQYCLTYQKFYADFIVNIQAFFEERGTTGMRDALVYELCRREGRVGKGDDPFAGWAQDPYDAAVSAGALMNLSEREEYDARFVGFPLTMCRAFIRALEAGEAR